MFKTYNYILHNFQDLSTKQFWELVNSVHLESLALFLKNKFNDKRSIDDLVLIIKQEYSI